MASSDAERTEAPRDETLRTDAVNRKDSPRGITHAIDETKQGSAGQARGGRLQPLLMRPTPQLSVKTRGGGGVVLGGGSAGGCRGGVRPRGGVPKVGGPARDPVLPHAYLQGGCVSGGLGVRTGSLGSPFRGVNRP